MKRVQDPKLKTAKIQQILKQYFSKENGVGVDGQILREILSTPADKVTASMLISAQVCVIKALEEEWGERYLATFPATKSPQPRKEKVLRNDLLQMAGNGGKMPNKWRVFYAFIKRGGRFLASMQDRSLRRDFEQFLMTVGREPSEKNRGWSDIMANSLDSQMNEEL